jgi:hypothetical protein
MSVSAGDPTERASGPVNDDITDDDALEEEDEAAPSLLAQALEGWELMSEAAAETDPGLASLMSSGALIARAAVEQEIPSFIAELKNSLANTGLTPDFQEELIEELSWRISGSPCQFTLDWLIKRHVEAVRAFLSGRQGPNDDSRNFLDATASRAIRSAFGYDIPNQSVDQEWRIIAALEQPGKIDHRGSLFCATSKRSWRKNVRLKETTYLDITYPSKPSGDVEQGRWVTLRDSGGGDSLRDFDARESAGFPKSILENPSSASYLLELHVGGRLAPLASEVIQEHEAEILGLATKLTGSATAALQTIAPHLMLVPPEVFKAVPKVILWTIKNIINKRLSDRTLPSWVIYHTAFMPIGHAPVSVVLLRSPEQSKAAKATLVGTTCVNGEMRESQNYEAFQVADLWPRGRFIDGATVPTDPAESVPVEVPDRIWNFVADSGRPLVWSDCWENGQPTHGFRVLVPFDRVTSDDANKHFLPRKRKTQAYVAALRVEVYPIPVQPVPPPPKIKKYTIH